MYMYTKKSLLELNLGVNQFFNDGKKNYKVIGEPTGLTSKAVIDAVELPSGKKVSFGKYFKHFYAGELKYPSAELKTEEPLPFKGDSYFPKEGQLVWNKDSEEKGKYMIDVNGEAFVSYESDMDYDIDFEVLEPYQGQDVKILNEKNKMFTTKGRVLLSNGNVTTIVMTTGNCKSDLTFEGINLVSGELGEYNRTRVWMSQWIDITDKFHHNLVKMF